MKKLIWLAVAVALATCRNGVVDEGGFVFPHSWACAVQVAGEFFEGEGETRPEAVQAAFEAARVAMVAACRAAGQTEGMCTLEFPVRCSRV